MQRQSCQKTQADCRFDVALAAGYRLRTSSDGGASARKGRS